MYQNDFESILDNLASISTCQIRQYIREEMEVRSYLVTPGELEESRKFAAALMNELSTRNSHALTVLEFAHSA